MRSQGTPTALHEAVAPPARPASVDRPPTRLGGRSLFAVERPLGLTDHAWRDRPGRPRRGATARPRSSREWPDERRPRRACSSRWPRCPPLVFAGEARNLTASLGQVADGEAFLLQAGDCAESFDAFSRRRHPGQAQGHPADGRRAHLLVGRARSVKVGRIAGQFAKPRSRRHRDASTASSCPSFRGHIVNDIAPTAAARTPDPERLLQAYHQSRVDAEPAAGLHQGRLRRPLPGAPVEPGVRRARAARAGATSASPTRSTARCAS